jgi:hypothetical protein
MSSRAGCCKDTNIISGAKTHRFHYTQRIIRQLSQDVLVVMSELKMIHFNHFNILSTTPRTKVCQLKIISIMAKKEF